MTGNKVMKLWTVLVTAFMAVFGALGFASAATAATSVQQAEGIRNCAAAAPSVTRPVPAPWTSPHDRTLPPTMKQRIHAEAHGAAPACRPAASPAEPSDAVAPAARTRPAAAPASPDGTRVTVDSATVSDSGITFAKVEYENAAPARTPATTASPSGSSAQASSSGATSSASASASVNASPAPAHRPASATPQDRRAPRSAIVISSPVGYPALIQAAVRAPRS